MNLEDTMLSDVSQTQKEKPVWFYLYAESKKVKYIEAKSRKVVTRGGEVGEMRR